MNFLLLRPGRWLAVLALASLTWLGGCGGGGGDASPSGSSGAFRVSIDQSSLSFEYIEGTSIFDVPPQYILATASGELPNELYVLATTDGQGINPEIPTEIDGTGARFLVRPAGGLRAGVYRGQLSLYACADDRCARPIGGTPKQVSYTVTVHRQLNGQAPDNLRVVSGESLTFMLPVTLPDNATGFTATPGESSPLKLGAPTPQGLPVTIGGPLRTGRYQHSVFLKCSGACTQTAGVNIFYEVTPPPGGEHGIVLSTRSLTFAASEGRAAPEQAVHIDLPTWGGSARKDLRFSQPSQLGWLKLTPTDTGVSLQATAAHLSRGTYTDQISVIDPGANVAETLFISLTVGEGLIRPADTMVEVNADSTPQDLQRQLTINVNGDAQVGYVASSSKAWLQLPQTSGATGQPLTVRIDPQALHAAEGVGTIATATVTVRPTTAPYSPIQFLVSATVRLPSLSFVMPQQVLADQAQTVQVRGVGLSKVSRIEDLLRLDGQALSNVVRSGDKLTLALPALSEGSHELRIQTHTGLTIAPLTLRAAAPVSLPYAALEPIGQPAAMFYDMGRRALFTLDAAAAKVKRYTWAGGGSRWTVVTHPQALQALGLGHDGEHLLVSDTAGNLSLIHADTFNVKQGPLNWSLSTGMPVPPYGEILNRSNGMAIFRSKPTARLLGTTTSGVDLTDFSLTGAGSALRTSAHLGTSAIMHRRMLVTPDGERALFMSALGTVPGYTTYLSSSPEDTFLAVIGRIDVPMIPNDLLAMSANGDRTLTGWSESERPVDLSELRLWNRQFSQSNQLQWSSAGQDQLVGAALSPDGSKAYVITHPLSDALPQQARLYVFDTTTPLLANQTLMEVGYADLPILTDCAGTACQSDWPRLLTQVSPDGRTLFIAGRKKLLVLPLPETSALSTASRAMVRATAVRRQVNQPVRWR
ncbi:MAG: hypothetical protein RI907_3387 [Pseudomonadota bacterium]|jgi:hypothetical protein